MRWMVPSDGEPLPHGYTNDAVVHGDLVVKTYHGPDSVVRQDREVLAIVSLTGRLPVAPFVESTPGTVVLGRVPGRPGQDLIELGHGDAVMFALGRTLRELQTIEPSFYGEYGGDGVLVHGDYGPNNVLLAEDDASVALLADWEWSTIGHPTTDLAWAEFIVRMHHPRHVDCLSALFDGYGHRPSWNERKTAMTDRAGALETWLRSWKDDDAAEWDRRSRLIAQWEELR